MTVNRPIWVKLGYPFYFAIKEELKFECVHHEKVDEEQTKSTEECNWRTWLPHMYSLAEVLDSSWLIFPEEVNATWFQSLLRERQTEQSMFTKSAWGRRADRKRRVFPEMISTWFWWELKPCCPFCHCQKPLCSHGNQQSVPCFHSKLFGLCFFLLCSAAGSFHLCVDFFELKSPVECLVYVINSSHRSRGISLK